MAEFFKKFYGEKKEDEEPLRILKSETLSEIKHLLPKTGFEFPDDDRIKEIFKGIPIKIIKIDTAREFKNLRPQKIKCENCGHIYDYVPFEHDCICERCNRFSANLYNFAKDTYYRLKLLKSLDRDDERNRLEYLGIVFDSTFQVYPISERKNQNKLDYISGRYLYENSDFYKKTKKSFCSENLTAQDLISLRRAETFSFNYNKLTFIFTGEFTSEIRNGLIENTTNFIEHLFSLDIIKYENLCSDILCEPEVEKLASYIQILEDILVGLLRVQSFKRDQIIDNFFQKITFQ